MFRFAQHDRHGVLTFVNFFAVVTSFHVLRKDRSSLAPGAQTVMDQSAFAIQSSFLFNQGAHFRSALAHGLRKRAMPKSMGMLESGHRDFHDRWRPLHARVRILRRDNR
jgi:hypothetical protein